MFKKKIVVITGAVAVAVSLVAGVTYAWFTNTQSYTYNAIQTGQLGINFTIVPNEPKDPADPERLYPQSSKLNPDTGFYEPDIKGAIDDVVKTVFTLKNTSDRPVLVKLSGAKWIADNIYGSDVDPDTGNAIPSSMTKLPKTDAIMMNYSFGTAENIIRLDNNDAYILLGIDEEINDIAIQIWIDGELSDNTYQNATIDLSNLTAKAVQYREDAISSVFAEEIAAGDISIDNISEAFDEVYPFE